jgi:hypothetical protein
MTRKRVSPADALVRPAMAAAPTEQGRPPAVSRRYTVDLDTARHAQLRRWALDVDVPASLLVAAVLDLVARDPSVRARIETEALELAEHRRSRGGMQ